MNVPQPPMKWLHIKIAYKHTNASEVGLVTPGSVLQGHKRRGGLLEPREGLAVDTDLAFCQMPGLLSNAKSKQKNAEINRSPQSSSKLGALHF